MKLVAVLHHPAERAFSSYLMHVRWGIEKLSLADAVAAELASEPRAGMRRRHCVLTGF